MLHQGCPQVQRNCLASGNLPGLLCLANSILRLSHHLQSLSDMQACSCSVLVKPAITSLQCINALDKLLDILGVEMPGANQWNKNHDNAFDLQ